MQWFSSVVESDGQTKTSTPLSILHFMCIKISQSQWSNLMHPVMLTTWRRRIECKSPNGGKNGFRWLWTCGTWQLVSDRLVSVVDKLLLIYWDLQHSTTGSAFTEDESQNIQWAKVLWRKMLHWFLRSEVRGQNRQQAFTGKTSGCNQSLQNSISLCVGLFLLLSLLFQKVSEE